MRQIWWIADIEKTTPNIGHVSTSALEGLTKSTVIPTPPVISQSSLQQNARLIVRRVRTQHCSVSELFSPVRSKYQVQLLSARASIHQSDLQHQQVDQRGQGDIAIYQLALAESNTYTITYKTPSFASTK